jgi:hypothetical protein
MHDMLPFKKNLHTMIPLNKGMPALEIREFEAGIMTEISTEGIIQRCRAENHLSNSAKVCFISGGNVTIEPSGDGLWDLAVVRLLPNPISPPVLTMITPSFGIHPSANRSDIQIQIEKDVLERNKIH